MIDKVALLLSKGEKPLLVATFSSDSHFSPYILFLPLLVLILKNASHFSPYHYIKMEEADVANGRNKKILNYYPHGPALTSPPLVVMWPSRDYP